MCSAKPRYPCPKLRSNKQVAKSTKAEGVTEGRRYAAIGSVLVFWASGLRVDELVKDVLPGITALPHSLT